MVNTRTRWVVLGASVVVAAFLVRLGWEHRQGQRSLLATIDNRAGIEQLLHEGLIAPADRVALSPDFLVQRRPWTGPLVKQFYPLVGTRGAFVYDQVLGCRRASNLRFRQRWDEHPDGGFLVQTNAHGFRDDEIAESVDLRILFAGDSQTEGVCGTRESFVNLLEAALCARHPGQRVDALNAALGGSNPWYYLTTLEALVDLEPDIFVAVFYGGNDLREVLALERFYRGRPPGVSRDRQQYGRQLAELPPGLGAVELHQIKHFLDNPADARIAVDTWTAIAMEMHRQCQARGIEFLAVYMPAPLAGQPGPYAEELKRVEACLPEIAAGVDPTACLGARWLEELRRHGLEPLDLSPALGAAQERLFWEADYHLNLAGQAVVAAALEEALADRVASLLARR